MSVKSTLAVTAMLLVPAPPTSIRGPLMVFTVRAVAAEVLPTVNASLPAPPSISVLPPTACTSNWLLPAPALISVLPACVPETVKLSPSGPSEIASAARLP